MVGTHACGGILARDCSAGLKHRARLSSAFNSGKTLTSAGGSVNLTEAEHLSHAA
jgi:hypothetical protein